MPLDQYRETLVLYRMRPIARRQVGSGTSCGARPIQLFEGSRPWGGGTLWNLNRFWSQKPCQTGSFAKIQLLMLIDI